VAAAAPQRGGAASGGAAAGGRRGDAVSGTFDLLDDIAFGLDVPGLLKRLRLAAGGEDAARAAELAAEAAEAARPKAFCRLAYVESRDDDSVVIDGVPFASRVLRVNLDAAHRVFAYLATCGRELHDWAGRIDDPLEQYWADAIKAAALGAALAALHRHVEDRYRPGPSSHMNPGSLADWPIEQQRPLFALLGPPAEALGVALTDSFLMVPNKSVSGLRFETASSFQSCQLCPREVCPGRRAPYDATLYERKYRQEK